LVNTSNTLRGRPQTETPAAIEHWASEFMDYDLGYFDLETRVLEPLDNPFGPKV
jgi:hypothetical protein